MNRARFGLWTWYCFFFFWTWYLKFYEFVFNCSFFYPYLSESFVKYLKVGFFFFFEGGGGNKFEIGDFLFMEIIFYFENYFGKS